MKGDFQRGQSLVEVVVALSVAAIVITSLLVVVINALKNARFAQNQTRATKYATEGLEKIRAIRDRDGTVQFNFGGKVAAKFSDLWRFSLTSTCASASSPGGCSFRILDLTLIKTNLDTEVEDLGDGLTRQVVISDQNATSGSEKTVTVRVRWADASGSHESHLQTILTRIR